MNDKLIKIGKATLAAVMATSVGMSSFTSLPIFAEENKEDVKEVTDALIQEAEVDTTEPMEEEPATEESGTEEVEDERTVLTETRGAATAKTEELNHPDILRVTATSAHGSTPIANSFDGTTDTYTDSDYGNPDGANPQVYTIELKQVKSLKSITFSPRISSTNGRVNHMTVEVSVDGAKYTQVASADIDTTKESSTKIPCTASNAKFVKLTMTSADFNQKNVITVGDLSLELTEEVVATGENLAQGKNVTASASYPQLPKENAVDGNKKTRWSTETSKVPESICVDLGQEMYVDTFQMYWESNQVYAKNYEIYVTNDPNDRTNPVVTRKGNTNEVSKETLSTPAKGRYVILNVSDMVGYVNVSMNEFEIFMNGTLPNEEKKALDTAIKEAEALLKVHGGQYGTEYKSRVNAYQTAINEAKKVLDKAGVTSEECLAAKDALAKATTDYSKRDTSKLEEKVKEWENFTSTDSTYEKFVEKLEDARKAIENPSSVAQKTIDYLTINVETRAYCTKVAELNTKYSPSKYDYTQHAVETSKDVLYMYQLTLYRTNNNYSEVIVEEGEQFRNPDLPGQMKGWYEQYVKAMETMTNSKRENDQCIPVPASLMNRVLNTNDKQGTFKVVDEKYKDGKTTIKVQFISNGLHPIFGEELPNANSSDTFEPFSKRELEKEDFKFMTYKNLNESSIEESTIKDKRVFEMDGYNAVEGTFEISEDIKYVGFTFGPYKKDAVCPWVYEVDRVAPTLEAKPDVSRELQVGDLFNALDYVVAVDNGKDVTQSVKFDKAVDTTKVGKYTVNYTITDAFGNTTTLDLEFEVIQPLVDINAIPKILVKNETEVLQLNDSYDLKANLMKATDAEDGDLTEWVQAGSNVDTSKPGTYETKYSVTDKGGLTGIKTVKVIVNAPPVLEVEDATVMTGSSFDPLQIVKAMDEEDGNLTSKVKVEGTVDTNKAGTYKLTYNVTDSYGATTSKTIQVIVEKKAVTPEKPNTENKPNDKKDPEKGNGTNTGVATATGLFAGLVGTSATAAAILETLKRRKK